MTINVHYSNGTVPFAITYKDVKSWVVSNDNGRDLVIIKNSDQKIVINKQAWTMVEEVADETVTNRPKEV